jgi:UDP-N-acetylmuramoylalanine--D-glutamate ligase
VIVVGAAAEKIAADLEGAVPIERAGTLDRAVKLAVERAHPGDTVLLAPACSSFDQFENYEQRGRVFKQLVAQLEQSAASAAARKG